jgi:hypothetical protein
MYAPPSRLPERVANCLDAILTRDDHALLERLLLRRPVFQDESTPEI